MTQQVNENRPGPLNKPDDFLKALQGLVNDFNKLVRAFNTLSSTPMTFAAIVAKPNTLSGYGIIDAAPLKHTHLAADILDLPAASTGIVAWSAITGKPYTVDGFGIIDASKVGHKHHWSDILDPPPVGVGPVGPPGPPSTVPGPPGPASVGMPGLDGRDGLDSFIPGPAGKKGDRGPVTPPIIWFETAPPLEPMMIPGNKGAPGAAGGVGPPGAGSASHEGVLAFGPPEVREPLMIPGPRGASTPSTGGTGGHEGVIAFGLPQAQEAPFGMGIPGRNGLDAVGFASAGEWNAAAAYVTGDVVGYQGSLWWTKFGHPPGDKPGVTADWIQMLQPLPLRQGPPSWEVAPPIEPLLIPGARGATGAPGAVTLALTVAEVSLGATPLAKRSGHVQITGLAGLTPGKAVLIQQAAGPYTGKGTRADEAEMDLVEATAKVLNANTIDIYWNSRYRVRGNFKFQYAVST